MPAIRQSRTSIAGRRVYGRADRAVRRFGRSPAGRRLAEHSGGDARVMDVEAESLTVTASQGGAPLDRRFKRATNIVSAIMAHADHPVLCCQHHYMPGA